MVNNRIQYNTTPITLVAAHVNFCLKRLCYFSPYLDFNRVKVEFKLKLKKSANDEEILNLFKDPN